MCNAQAYMWFFSVYCLYVCLVSSWAIKGTFLSLFPTSTLYKHRRWKSLTGAAHSWVGKGMHPGKLAELFVKASGGNWAVMEILSRNTVWETPT